MKVVVNLFPDFEEMGDESTISDLRLFDATIKIPAGIVIYGQSQCGKTTFIHNLIEHRNRIFSEPIDYIVYFYGERSKTIDELENDESLADIVTLVDGLPIEQLMDYIREGYNGLFILDDHMDTIVRSKECVDLVTKKCHHRKISWVATFQNPYHHGPDRLTVTRSAQIIILFNSPLDRSIAQTLASRIMPGNRRSFLEIFDYATRNPYTYLFCDGQATTPKEARLRSDLFNKYQTVYIPKKY